MSRHPNEQPFEIHRTGHAQGAVGEFRKLSKRAKSAEIELLTRDFLANGGQIEQVPSERIESKWNPAFNWNPAFEESEI